MKPVTVGGLLVGCVAFGTLAGACNALTGINDFVTIPSEAGNAAGLDEGVGEGSSGSKDAPTVEGGGAEVGPSVDGGGDGESGAGDASDAPSDARSAGASDGANDAGPDGADAGNGADGCAVGTPVCDAGCPTAHSDGLGHTFYDCVAWGTMNETQALEACVAFTGSAALCANDPIGCANANEVCSSGASTCACWNYSGLHVGKVFASTTTTCSCYIAGAASWN